MTVEPPKGIKANLLRSYTGFTDEYLNSCGATDSLDALKTAQFKLMLQVIIATSIIYIT